MKAIKFLIAMFFLFIVIVFGTANSEKVSINYWMGKPLFGYMNAVPAVAVDQGTASSEMPNPVLIPRKVPLWSVLFACFIMGFFVAYFIMLQDTIRFRSQLRKTKKVLLKTEKELQDRQTQQSVETCPEEGSGGPAEKTQTS